MHDHGITRERTLERLAFFVEKGLAKISNDMKEINVIESPLSNFMMDFFRSLVLPLVDTYLIVLLAIEQLCGKNIVLK